jgi:hypothetical protein
MAQQQMSLFGPSLAQTQAALAQEDEAITAKLAQLTPEQGLVRIAMQGGRQAGRALGGLFGIEDPRLKEAAQQEAIFKELKDSGVDFTDSEQLYPALINAYQSRGMIDKAIVAAAKYEDVKSTSLKTQAEIGLKEAQAKQAEAKAKAAGQVKPSELGTLQAERDALRTRMQNSTSELEKVELDQRIKEIDNAIATKTTAKEKAPPSVGQDREALAQDMFDTDFYSLTQEQKRAVNERYDKLVRSKTPNINIDTKDLYGFVRGANADLAPIVKQVSTLETALNLLNQQSSPFASRALEQQIASVFGDANKAREEIKALANTGSLDERIANNILNFLSGTKTDATKADQLTVLRALRSKLGKDYENMATPLRSALESNKNVDPNKVIPPFSTRFGGLPLSTTGQRTTKSGTTYTVED